MMILERLVVGPLASNCYIVGDESTKEGMVIDPGDDGERILESIEKLGLNVKFVVLTHGHFDHVGAAAEVKKATGAELAIHSADAKALHGQSLGAVFGFAQPALPQPDRLLADGDSFGVGDLSFKVLHTPGHTLGGICLSGPGVVFTGDTLFRQSVGRYDLAGGSYEQLMTGIGAKLLPLHDETIVYPGHGPETTIGAERSGNPFLGS